MVRMGAGQKGAGAGEGNRTLVFSLGSFENAEAFQGRRYNFRIADRQLRLRQSRALKVWTLDHCRSTGLR